MARPPGRRDNPSRTNSATRRSSRPPASWCRPSRACPSTGRPASSRASPKDRFDYPADRLEVIFASDGSDDGTDARVGEIWGRSSDGPRRTLLSLPRLGKNAALNAAAAAASGEILVFSDADSHLAPDAIRRLVAPLTDPSIGAAGGDFRYAGRGGEGERAYWSFDRFWKRLSSRAGSMTSATGQIYAIRAALFEPAPDGVTDDFFVSTGAIAAGKRLWFAEDAVATGRVASSSRAEFRRKVRVMARGLASVWARRALLDPRRHGFYALQLFTHKVLRRALGVPVAVAFVCAIALAPVDPLYAGAAAIQALVHGAALAGWGLRASHPRRSARARAAALCRPRARGGRARADRRRARSAPSGLGAGAQCRAGRGRRRADAPGSPRRAGVHARRRRRVRRAARLGAAVLRRGALREHSRHAARRIRPALVLHVPRARARRARDRRASSSSGNRRAGAGRRRSGGCVAWGAVILASFLYAIDRTRTAATLFDYLDALFIVLIVTLFVRRRDQIAPIVWALIGAGVFLAVLTVHQGLTGNFGSTYGGFARGELRSLLEETEGMRSAGPLSTNYFALILVALVPLAGESACCTRARSGRAGSPPARPRADRHRDRLHLLARRVRDARRTRRCSRCSRCRESRGPRSCAAPLALAAGIALLPDTYLERMSTFGQIWHGLRGRHVEDSAIRGRISEVRSALMMVGDHPLIGVGSGNYEIHYPQYARVVALDGRREERAAHSLYLEVAAENGLFGLTVFGGLLGFALLGIFRTRKTFADRGENELLQLSTALAIAFAGFLIGSVFLHLSLSALPVAARGHRAGDPRAVAHTRVDGADPDRRVCSARVDPCEVRPCA